MYCTLIKGTVTDVNPFRPLFLTTYRIAKTDANQTKIIGVTKISQLSVSYFPPL